MIDFIAGYTEGKIGDDLGNSLKGLNYKPVENILEVSGRTLLDLTTGAFERYLKNSLEENEK